MGLKQLLCVVYLANIWAWAEPAHGATWQEHRNAGFDAFESGDISKAVKQFETALSVAYKAQVTAQYLAILLEHLATASLADRQYQRAQESIDRWDRILVANEDQAWTAEHRAVLDKLSAITSKALDENLNATVVVTPLQPSKQNALPPFGSDTYAIHLVSVKSEDNAIAAWESLKDDHPDLLEGKRLTVRQIDLGDRGIFHRVVAVPFESAAKARSVCAEFEKRNQYCAVISREQVSLSQL